MFEVESLVSGRVRIHARQRRGGPAQQGEICRLPHQVLRKRGSPESSSLPDTGDLLAAVSELINASITDSTQSTYKASWTVFDNFRLSIKAPHCMLPIPTQLIVLFIAYLYRRGHKAPTIRSHLSAISYPHNLLNLYNPVENFLISKLCKGVSVLIPSGDVRLPITLDILKSLMNVITVSSTDFYEAQLYKAMCSFAFYGFMRCSEICYSQHCIMLNQIGVFVNSHVSVSLTSFKHNTEGKVFTLRLNQKQDVSCPVTNLVNYLKVRGSQPGPLFCKPAGSAISPSTFRNKLRSFFSVMGLNERNFKSHSFRIGAACHALSLGRTENEIQILGRWASPPALRKYLRVAGLHAL